MEQHDGKRAVEEQHDPARERQGIIAGSCLREDRSEPAFDPLLMGARRNQGWVAGKVDKFERGAQKAAALPFGVACRLRQMAKNTGNLLCDIAFRFLEPAFEESKVRLVARLEMGGDQVILAAEMIVERALGDAGLFGDGIDADRTDTVAMKKLSGGLKNAFACRLGTVSHSPMYTG